ncbi:MAG: hypothetical protein V2A79_18015 [Planctomycetota bacterium]
MTSFRFFRYPTVFALGCIGAGIIFRLALSMRAPVSYDEVFVMGVGLDEMGTSARAFFIDVPLRRSNGITPLWWWVQALPPLMAGRITLGGLRVAPLLLSGVALAITFRTAAARVGRGPAALFVMFAASSDVLAFCSARGEFAESLLLLWVLPGVSWVGSRRHTLAKGLLGGLMLMTHLGKGLFLVVVMALSDAVVQGVRYRARGAMVRPCVSLAIALVPTVCWLVLAGGLAADGPLMTDIGPVAGPAEALWKLTAGYAETKRHMVGTPFDALQVWLDGGVWPLTTISALPALVGVIAAVSRRHGRRGGLGLGLMVWTGLGLAAVVAGGLVGARFHLLYLPAVWLAASIGLWRLRRLAGPRILVLGGLWAASVWAAFSWASWAERLWRPGVFAFILAGACTAAVGLLAWHAQARLKARGRNPWDRLPSLSKKPNALQMTDWKVGPTGQGKFHHGQPSYTAPAACGESGQERCGTGIQAPAETQAGSLCHNFCHGLLAVAGALCAGVMLGGVLAWGPLRWAPFARLEPYAGTTELAAVDAYRLGKASLPGPTGRTLYIDLANYFLKKDGRSVRDLQRAEYYARLETERIPDDARAWFYWGETQRELGAPAEKVRSAWERSYGLHPAPLVEQKLRELRGTPSNDEPRP